MAKYRDIRQALRKKSPKKVYYWWNVVGRKVYVRSDHPTYQVVRTWEYFTPDGREYFISRAKSLIADLDAGRVGLREASSSSGQG